MKAWVFILPLLLCSCSSVGKLLDLSKAKSPVLTVTPTPNGPAVTQTGDTAAPSHVVTTETQANIPVPAGSVITITPPVESKTQPAPITLTTRSTAITGPRSIPPPAPPTASQLANADGIRQSYYFAGLLVVGAGFLFWRQHTKAALVALGCAVAGPVIANFVGTDLAQKVLIGGACVSAALFAAWHFMHDKTVKVNNPIQPNV